MNGELLDNFVLNRMGKIVEFEFNYEIRNNCDKEGISKLILNYFIMTKLHSLLKENKVNEAFDFFMDVFDEYYYGSQFGTMGL